MIYLVMEIKDVVKLFLSDELGEKFNKREFVTAITIVAVLTLLSIVL